MADISRADALALIREQNASEIWQAVPEYSAALRTFRRVNLGTKITNYPVIASLPSAGFVDGEDADDADSQKPTTAMTWTDRDLVAEEIAGIVVIPENVIDDAGSDFDLWAEIKPRIAEAVGATLDAAVFFGTNAPGSWPTGIVPAAITAGNTTTEGTNNYESSTPGNDLGEDLNALIGLVEEDGYDPTAIFARRTLRQRVRGLRDANGQPIYQTSLSETGRNVASIYGVDVEYVTNGAWDSATALAVAGDPRYAIIGIRQDLTYKFLDQAAVTIGSTLVSLAEHDLLGLRFKMRVGFQTAQVRTQDGGADAYPFAVLEPAGS